jgi:hypothetical protein
MHDDMPCGVPTTAPPPVKTCDHDLTGRLSRGEFAARLWTELQQVPVQQQQREADTWSDQLMKTAKHRHITWWPSLGSAQTAVPIVSSAVQSALEEVLDATPPPHRRDPDTSTSSTRASSDTAVATALREHLRDT